MEYYIKHYVNRLHVSEREYDEALKDGNVEVRKVIYRDGEIISDVINSPLIHDLDARRIYFEVDSEVIECDYEEASRNLDRIKDMVNSPDHYIKLKEELNGLEIIDILEVVSEQYPIRISGHIWNALKYLFRAPFKGRLKQDIEKSVWYLNRALKRLGDDVE